jgi:hypothetical protein
MTLLTYAIINLTTSIRLLGLGKLLLKLHYFQQGKLKPDIRKSRDNMLCKCESLIRQLYGVRKRQR